MKRAAFTLVELLVVILIIGLLLAILIPSLSKANEAFNRAKCAQNLAGIAKALTAYFNEQNPRDRFPEAARCNGYGAYPSTGGTQVNTTGSLWILVTSGRIQADAFVCPSDRKADHYRDAIDAAYPFPRTAKTVSNKLSISYCYQVPHQGADASGATVTFNPGPERTSNVSRFAIMADRSPFDVVPSDVAPRGKILSDTGAPWSAQWAAYGATNQSTGPLADRFITEKRIRPVVNQNTVFNGLIQGTEGRSAMDRVNSPNHGGEGQNVLYRDGHAEWKASPLAGVNYDNIYTRATGAATTTSVLTRVVGTAPITSGATSTPYDFEDSYLQCYPLPDPW